MRIGELRKYLPRTPISVVTHKYFETKDYKEWDKNYNYRGCFDSRVAKVSENSFRKTDGNPRLCSCTWLFRDQRLSEVSKNSNELLVVFGLREIKRVGVF